jgi:FlaA1/EpsC-like NDP-sugar epimerase
MFKLPDKNTPRWIIFTADIGICLFSLLLAYLIRFDFLYFPIKEEWPVLKFSLPLYLFIRTITFYFGKTYSGIVRYTSTQDTKRIFAVVTVGTAAIILLSLIRQKFYDGFFLFPISVICIEYVFTIFFMVTSRIAVKLLYAEQHKNKANRKRVLIYGAGRMGLITKNTFERDVSANYEVVAFIDDDDKKSGKFLEGKKIFHTSKIDEILKTEKIEEIIIAILNVNHLNKQHIIETALKHDINVLTVPAVHKWINGELSYKQIKKIKIEDLLGREPIVLDENNIAAKLSNKIILVTGAAGSIGSEIVRQVLKFNPKKLILLDRAESPLYDLEMQLRAQELFAPCETVIGDITQQERMQRMFDYFNPEVVFHAAAYKHVPLMEDNPSEAVNVNIHGTKVMVDLSITYNVERFIFISTDKAVNPTSVMGASKRVAEIYAQAANNLHKTKFITTRFGNVLGSNGSVIPLFRKQIESGGPVTVTHPEVNRYFMTIPEACSLVLEAGAMGNGGEIYIFDMGKSVKIIDLAKKMIKLSGFEPDKDIKIKITGLRPGEKLYEELLNDKENTLPTHHPQILVAKVIANNFDTVKNHVNELIKLFETQDNKRIVMKMKQIVPEYISNNSVYSQLDNK